MYIPPDVIIEYLRSKFTDYRETEQEFITDSIFTEDHNKHLSVNMETGLWQDFKSGMKGNFPQLVAFIENISPNAAVVFIGRKLLDSPEFLFYKDKKVELECKTPKEPGAAPYKETIKLFKPLTPSSRISNSVAEMLAWRYCNERGLDIDGMMYCEEGKYANRLIIPYRNESGNIYFWQARALGKSKLKYLNPSKDETVDYGAADIIYKNGPDKPGELIVVTEGVVDAITVKQLGLNATCVNGSNMSRKQAQLLKGMKKRVILSFDSDEPGRKGMNQAAKMLASVGVTDIMFMSPPDGFKDWNDAVVDMGAKAVGDHMKGALHTSFLRWKLISELS